MKRKIKSEVEELDLVSAIWILASNDEKHLITYRGIQFRLNLPDSYDLKVVIARRPGLFRFGANPSHIEEWKSEMLQGKHLPGWIKAITAQAERETAIRSLSGEDVFRSQFRAGRNAEASPLEIIKWGLEHLDLQRKAKAEEKDASVKRWQMWLVFWVSLLGVLSQFGIAYAKFKNWI